MTTSVPFIVVGVDGSPGSQSALAFAFREAALRGAAVHAVHGWSYPIFYGDGYMGPIAEYEANAQRVLERAVDRATTLAAESGQTPVVTARAGEGHPVELLRAASRGAELLVVGSRGHGGFVGLMLGSVGLGCVSGAPCPVVVVPDRTAVQPAAS